MIKRFLLLMILPILMVSTLIMSQSSVKNPHGKLKWDCQDCHLTDSWSKIREDLAFDHGETGFQLVGAHQTASCIGCHKSPVFSHVSTSCIDCHTDQHQGQLGEDCQKCHSSRDWGNQQNNFELHAARGFALVGAHTIADCDACHVGHAKQEYLGTSTDCASCHITAYNSTVEPAHADLGFSTLCEDCHSPSRGGWTGANFTHPVSFPLTNGHQGVACQSCHPSGYTNIPADCISCHASDFQTTTEPNHQLAQFNQDCLGCHTTVAWKPGSFDHATTGYLLTGQHTTALCSSCHSTQFSGTASDCFSCHQTDYQTVTVPNHLTQGFSQDCASCHTTNGWIPSSFNHSTTTFPLTGQHAIATCVSCHSSGYAGTPTNCASCHQNDFNGTTNPNHAAASFPNTCQTCHTTNGWTPSTWDHDTQYFPINTGAHSIVACGECHTAPTTFTSFSCIDCHIHSKSVTDGHHSQVNNYQYLSSSCYSCHPRGKN